MWIFEWVFGWFPSGGGAEAGIHFLAEPNELDFVQQADELSLIERTEDIDLMVH
jgi:hypothetical protein|tara:strand:- start:77 stop:238 length:162 start_codon:yes stop_codon:yes gene_type:complete